jgi:hypothetical protein
MMPNCTGDEDANCGFQVKETGLSCITCESEVEALSEVMFC